MTDIRTIALQAKKAFAKISRTPGEKRAEAVRALAGKLTANISSIVEANNQDIELGRQNGLSEALIDRLMLTPARIEAMAADVLHVANLADPAEEVIEEKILSNGIRLRKQRVPLGVIAVIYESRPNVTIDVSALTLKSGNAVILRGGKETMNSNRVLTGLIQEVLREHALPAEAVQSILDQNRELVVELLQQDDLINMVIPRGGAGLHEFCRKNSRIPVITGGIGVCHLFMDSSADPERSLAVIENAKVQRPSVCNALDTLLVHREIAAQFIPQVIRQLSPLGVSFRADPEALKLAHGESNVLPAGAEDFDTEWLSLVLGLKVVDGLDEAIEHIEAHSTAHSDGILTEDKQHAEEFVRMIDSSAVFVNASTRFNDGGQFGLGAEVAVSTQRLHARGPMGLPELMTYKWVVEGDYHFRK